MKGYPTQSGYMGYIPNVGYTLFVTENEYYEYIEDMEENKNETNR